MHKDEPLSTRREERTAHAAIGTRTAVGTGNHESIRPSALIRQTGGTYAAELGIDLASGAPAEVYKWFIAAVLFGAPISEAVAMRTWHEFAHASALAPRRMLDAGWDRLVELLDHGGYTRYDFKTATKLLAINEALMQQYKGNLNALHDSASGESDLERRVMELGKGIGAVTTNIFLRELRGVWPKADPMPSDRAIQAAKVLGFVNKSVDDPGRILQRLKEVYRKDRPRSKDFPAFEAALVRYGITLRRKGARRSAAGV
ncbi:MAG TPA: hypothetical protein VJ698_24025 [Noviherbaspirillum sp.]|uniref:hypothetical protein n=1 Tax=Noviherbaspirillum sp. TaxID=1926288 RepID=UPI002B4A5080|nr:hypothetical protein [Noviherbaspirillum sp.]HJV88554.1 hypothetical protein [Noviherbaspirillum sp.]